MSQVPGLHQSSQHDCWKAIVLAELQARPQGPDAGDFLYNTSGSGGKTGTVGLDLLISKGEELLEPFLTRKMLKKENKAIGLVLIRRWAIKSARWHLQAEDSIVAARAPHFLQKGTKDIQINF